MITDGVDADKLVSLVIKAKDIEAWLESDVKNSRRGFREFVAHQLRGDLAFRFGTLQLKQIGCGAGSGGIGGEGDQGVGIGGDESFGMHQSFKERD